MGTTIDLSEYIEVSVTAAAGYVLNLGSLTFDRMGSGSGPTTIRVAHDGGNGIFSAPEDFTVPTASVLTDYNFTDFSTTAGATVKFRIYGWGATGSSGTCRIGNLKLYATVTPVSTGGSSTGATPFIFDAGNTMAGLGKTPTQQLDVNGNIRASRLFIGVTDDTKITALAANTADNYLLAVNGTALFQKIKVKPYGSWPDFVFDRNYKLRSINEVELYIKEHKHLPGVPSANEVKQSGVDIGDNQKILLQKIEELTLYLIEQNKKIEKLQKQVSKLKLQR